MDTESKHGHARTKHGHKHDQRGRKEEGTRVRRGREGGREGEEGGGQDHEMGKGHGGRNADVVAGTREVRSYDSARVHHDSSPC